jgi:phosphoribosyl 1,2-cyclic phosphate phosphodiesterase
MEITFLGTGAADCYPNAFCQCPNCEQARQLGGRSVRKRSAALVNNDLLIDFGPDIVTAAIQHRRPLTQVRYCLQTHAHDDHLDPSLIFARTQDFGVEDAPRLHFYASDASLKRLEQLLEWDIEGGSLNDSQVEELLNLTVRPIQPGIPVQIGSYRVAAVPANHDPGVEPLLYAIESEGRWLFYGTDTGPLLEEAWQVLKQLDPRFDIVILDHTYGPEESGIDHLNAQQFIEHVARMREMGLLAGGARAFATHIFHTGNPVHPELSQFAARHGYEIAYDGLTVSIAG